MPVPLRVPPLQQFSHPLQPSPQAIKARAPPCPGVDGVVQQGLSLPARIQAQIQGQHILPGPVEEGHLPAAMGAGRIGRPRPGQIVHHQFPGKAGGGEAVQKPLPEQRRQVRPLDGRHIIADKGVPAVAEDGQETWIPPQSDDMEVPAKPPVRLGTVGRRFPLQKPLERKGQTQLHHAASWGMVIFSTLKVPFSASAIIMVISWWNRRGP